MFIKLWDYDSTSGDDLLGIVTLVACPGEHMPERVLDVHLDARFHEYAKKSGVTATVSFKYTVAGADAPTTEKAAARDRNDGVVTRREIREMSEAEQERYAKAVLQMARTETAVDTKGAHAYLKTGAPHSEYYRLASYHGYPTDYCRHGTEAFPGWHRAYLREYERCLQAADRALGGDGRVALPYWDWLRPEVNGQCVPDVINKFFEEPPAEVVEELRRDLKAGRRKAKRFFERRGKEQLFTLSTQHQGKAAQLRRITAKKLDDKAADCLNVGLHKQHASKNKRATSLEVPHDGVHIAMRFPMSNLSWASWHPIFYMPVETFWGHT